MMNREQAIAYGKRNGVKYHVKNSLGGLLGGFTTKEAAMKYQRECEREYKRNPWNKGVKVYIVEV